MILVTPSIGLPPVGMLPFSIHFRYSFILVSWDERAPTVVTISSKAVPLAVSFGSSFFGTIIGSLSVQIIGNKRAISKIEFLRTIEYLLK